MLGRAAIVLLAVCVLAGCSSPRGGSPLDGPDPDQDPPAGPSADAASAGIRPGLGIDSYVVQFTMPLQGFSCTAGFLVRSPTNGSVYLATAGHCVKADQQVLAVSFEGYKPRHYLPLVYVSHRADPSVDQAACGNGVVFMDGQSCFNDLLLARLDADALAAANASVPVWGGPMPGEGSAAVGGQVYTHGATGFRGETPLPDARTGVTLAVREWSLLAQFSTSTPEGDSGSPVLDAQGRALGLVIARGPNAPEPVTGVTYVGLLRPMLDHAAQHGWHVEVIPGGPFTGLQ